MMKKVVSEYMKNELIDITVDIGLGKKILLLIQWI